MAIDDNTVYGLTGAQVKDLPKKVDAVKGLGKALTADDYNANSSDFSDTDPANFNCVALWKLPPGIYYKADSTVDVRESKAFNDKLGNSDIVVVGKSGTYGVIMFFITGEVYNNGPGYGRTASVSSDGTKGNSRSYSFFKVQDNLTSTYTQAPLSAKQGKVLKDLIDSLVISGAGAPTTSTVGTVGQLYQDTANGDLYICTDATNPYVWEEVGAGGESVVTLQYLDYNPNNDTEPSEIFPSWLIAQGVKPGQIVKLQWEENLGASMHFNMGTDYADNSVYKSLNYVYPEMALFVSAYNSNSPNDDVEYLKILVDTGSFEEPLSEWCWEISISDEHFLFFDRKILNTENVGGLNDSEYLKEAFSFTGGKRLNCILDSATNIENVGKVELDTSQYSGSNYTILTFDIANFDPSEPEAWVGEMEIDSDFQSYDFSQASVGDVVYVYVRNNNGLPFAFKPEYPSDFIFYLTDSNENVIEVPGLIYDYGSGGYSATNPVEVRPDVLLCLKLIEADTWVVWNQSVSAYYLPRSLSAGGSGVTELTSADYNWPTNNPDGVALWLLDTGVYEFNGIKVYASGNDLWSNSFTAVGTVDKGNNGSYFTYINGTNELYRVYVTEQSFTVYVHVFLTPASSAGNDTSLVMSQRATTSLVYADPSTKQQVCISDTTPGGNYTVAIGYSAQTGNGSATAVGAAAKAFSGSSTAMGRYAIASGSWSVAIGAGSQTTQQGQFDIGLPQYPGFGYGYNSSDYRLLTGLYDGQSNHDAATVAQGNKLMTTAPTTSTAGVLGQLWTDTTAMHTYQLTAIDTTDPDNPVYTWTQRW